MGGNKHDKGKPMIDLVPVSGILGVADVLIFGANKYGGRNWEEGLEWGRVYAALMRHLLAWHGGEDNDPESGMPHLHHVACNVFFLIEYSKTGAGEDNRPKAQE